MRKGNSKSRNNKAEPKIMNGFLICRLITSCLYKPGEIVDYYQNITSAGYFTRRLNGSDLVHPKPGSRCKTKDWFEVGTNPPWSIKLASLTTLTVLLHITNLGWPIPLAPSFIKCEIICKMPMIIMRPFKDK